MSLAGSRLSHDERVSLLMAEDRNEVASALDPLSVPEAKLRRRPQTAGHATETQPDAPIEEADEEADDRMTPDRARQADGVWQDLGQRDSVKRMMLKFFENSDDMAAAARVDELRHDWSRTKAGSGTSTA